MKVSVSKALKVASLVAFVAAAFGNTVLGHSGLELVAAGLALHTGAGTVKKVLK